MLSDRVAPLKGDGSSRRAVLRWLPLALAFVTSAARASKTPPSDAAELRIRVTGVRNGRGLVQYAIFDSAKHFPSRRGRVAKGEVPASSDGVTIVVDGLKPGIYAVAVFHDENRNDEFDQGIFGVPLEDYGFSNNARGVFAAPEFKAAEFELRGPRTTISITLGR